MRNYVEIITNKIIEFSFYALFFVTPLLFTSINSELYEFPKMFFVWATAILIVGAWGIRMVTLNRIIFHHTLLDLPLLLFLFSQIVSFLISIDHYTSFWGYYSRLNGGIASTITYIFLYWAFVSNMITSNTLQAIRFLLFSGLVVALWGIPAHFGFDPTCFVFGYGLDIDCWSSNFVPTDRIFSTLGQPNWLASWLVAIMPLSWALILNAKRKAENLQIILWITVSALFLLALIYTKSDSGFIGFIIGLIIFSSPFILSSVRQNMQRSLYVLSIVILILIVIIVLSPINRNFSPIQNCLSIISSGNLKTEIRNLASDVTPSSDIRCIVWRGAISIWKAHPLLGTGPETFAWSYYTVKPPEHNLTSEWNFLYNKAHNEYLNLLANTGTLGLISYVLLIGTILWLFIKKMWEVGGGKLDTSHFALLISLLAGFTSLLVTNFFGFSVVPTQLLFFLYPAFARALTHAPHPTSKPTTYDPLPISKLILLTLIILTTLYLLLSTFKYFLADVHYAKSQKYIDTGEYRHALSSNRSALEFRPREPLYWSELSDILSSLALISTNPDLASETSELAKNSSDTAISISPANITFWKTRANVFNKLGSIDTKYMSEAQKAYEKAAILAPTDAEITYNLAFFYWQADDLERSREQVEKALLLRPHYEDAKKLLRELSNSP